jgi:hypothetical protein
MGYEVLLPFISSMNELSPYSLDSSSSLIADIMPISGLYPAFAELF